MKAITFLIHTEQPVLATSFQGDPNSDVSYSYIPGSMIRGALISRYLNRHNLQDADIVSNFNIRRLFFNNTTRYLNAYLYSKEQRKRTLPVPHSWFKQKGDEVSKSGSMKIFDFSQSEIDEIPEELSPKLLGEGFCTVNSTNVLLYKEQRRINIHNQRDRRLGRAVEGSGEIFRYDALDTGQTFQAVILCDGEKDVDTIKVLLSPADIWLGGSQSAGYGHTKISEVKEHNDWHEIEVPPQDRSDRDVLHITLLSDLIARNKVGQYVPEPPTYLLKELLGKKTLILKKSYISSNYVGGFNRKWGLPLPQTQALSAGSVFVYESESTLDSEQIKGLEEQGVGERRGEGYGRIAVNWLEESSTFIVRKPVITVSQGPEELSPVATKLAEEMARRLLRQKLDSLLLEVVGRTHVKGPIKNSQLSRLIIVARQSLILAQDGQFEKSRRPIDMLLANLPSNARGQFERSKIGALSLNQQITNWLDNPKETWLENPPTIKVAMTTQEVTNQIAREYTLHLIMSVAKKAVKEKNQ